MGSKFRYLRICPLVVIIFFLILVFPQPGDLNKLPAKVRRGYLRRSKVWQKTDIASAIIRTGPQSPIDVRTESEVRCHYVEEPVDVGATPKFKCTLLDAGDIVRVKFSRRETYAEVAGTRLLWALGFYTDEAYPVKIRCFGCPENNPDSPAENEKRGERVIPDAIMERNFPGEDLAQYPDQGWKWSELDDVRSEEGGATKAEVDALKLLAVFIQHSDSKPSQQRLACYDEDLRWQQWKRVCAKPVLMIQDLGATFGLGYHRVGGFSAMYYKGWERVDIWNVEKEDRVFREKGRRTCFGRLTSAFASGLFDPEISEEGRRFFASLLNQLSDDQIRDLFRVARADQTDEMIQENGKETRVTIEHWLSAFKKKRNQINERRCI